MASTPNINIRVTGEENVTVSNTNISWTPLDKVEGVFTINSTDTAKTVSYTGVATVRTMYFYGTGSFKVNITASASTIAFETQDVFLFSPTAAFASTITAITISTTSTSDINVNWNIWGE